MSRTIDDKVIAMSFETTKFEAGVSSTISSLDKLKAALKFPDAGKGLQDIENAANKVTFGGLSGAIDKLKGKFGFGSTAQKDFSEVEGAANKVGLSGISNALDKIKGKFGFSREADQAFASVEKSSGRVTFSGLTQALDGLSSKFSIVSGAAAVAFGNLATKATLAGGQFAKSFTVGPIIQGLQEYQTNLGSIQTILANTEASGAGLKDVNKALQELNRYSDKTIYNFSEMAKNIGTFTAAGVDLKTATGAIKGIANLAALSGSNSQQASTAMYQLSQAIAAGRVSLQDWNSVVNAGMGGTVFQRALANTAQAMGTLSKGSVELKGKMKNVTIEGQSFRESITAKPGEKSWLTSDVLTNTLKQFTGDLSVAQLRAQGFNDEQIKAIRQTAKTAQNAATQVKTLGQVFDVAKETIGSGWSATFQAIFGDFKEAKSTFTDLSNTINGFINASSNARNKVLGDWKAMGGRKELILGIKTAWESLLSIMKPIHDAFREIFPRKTAGELFALTAQFQNLMASFKIGPQTADALKRTFKGLFAILDIGKQVFFGIIDGIRALFSAAGKGSGGVLQFTGNIGDLLVKLDEWLKRGDRLKDFFTNLGSVLGTPLRLIGKLTGGLNSLFSTGSGAGDAISSLDGIKGALDPSSKAIDGATKAWQAFVDVLHSVGDALKPVVTAVGDAFGNLGDVIANAISQNDFSNVFTVIQTGLIAGIFVSIKKALGGGLNVDIGGGALASATKSLNILQGSLVSMQKNIQAHTLLLIASAVGVLTASVVALSLIHADKLSASMTAIAVGMGELMGAMAFLNKFTAGPGFAKMPVIAASLILLAGAVDILAIAMVVLSKLSWEGIAKGLAGIAGMLVAISVAVGPLSRAGPGMIIAGAGMIAIGLALNVMAAAMKIFATMKWEDIAKGLIAMDLALGSIAVTTRGMSAQLLLTGPALIAVGIALAAIAGAVKIFASMDVGKLAKGIIAMDLALGSIAITMQGMPVTLPITAAGLILVGIALTGIAGAIALMGNMNIGTLAKGIGALAATLVVLAAGLTAMVASLPGAAALVVAAGALAILVPVIGILGNMPFRVIAKGLGTMVVSMLALSVAGAVAAPGLIALGAALTVLGAGIVLVGAGLYLMTSALVKLAGEGAKGIGVVLASFTAFIAILPKIIISFIKGLVEILASIAALAPKVAISMAKIIETMLALVIKEAPKFAEATVALITAMLTVLDKKAPAIIEAGWNLLKALLKGIDDHIVDVTHKVAEIVAKFLTALSDKLPQLVSAGYKVLIALLKGIADNLGKVLATAADIIAHLVKGIADNITKIVSAGVSVVVKFINSIADNAERIITVGGNMIIHLVRGIADEATRVVSSALSIATKFISTISSEIPKRADEVASAVIRMINDMAAVVRKREPEFIGAMVNLGTAIIQGFISGIIKEAARIPGELKKHVTDVIPGFIKKALNIRSPSRVLAEIGRDVTAGLTVGISDGHDDLMGELDRLTTSLVRKLDEIPEDLMDLNPVITPVLDLTHVQNGSKTIESLLNVVPITTAASYGQATAISSAQTATADTTESGDQPAIKFEQNNYSPESLSEIEIYRQTKNILSQAKNALGP